MTRRLDTPAPRTPGDWLRGGTCRELDVWAQVCAAADRWDAKLPWQRPLAPEDRMNQYEHRTGWHAGTWQASADDLARVRPSTRRQAA